MKKVLLTLFVAGILFSCKKPTTNIVAVVKAPIDSLIDNYNKAWNTHDSTAIRNLFADDALLIDDELIAKNGDEISSKWIHPVYKVVNNVTSSKLQEWTSNDRAGFSGLWTIQLKMKKKVMKVKGAYTVIWMKNDKGQWKIATADLHTIIPRK
jgi:ketosteroid isomerase-like protein